MDTKNTALNRICSGMISLSACALCRDSLSTIPAKNAPSASLTPASEVR
ncbi:hypothetical protein NOGI109294_26475 [Nocardiopsis gilva]